MDDFKQLLDNEVIAHNETKNKLSIALKEIEELKNELKNFEILKNVIQVMEKEIDDIIPTNLPLSSFSNEELKLVNLVNLEIKKENVDKVGEDVPQRPTRKLFIHKTDVNTEKPPLKKRLPTFDRSNQGIKSLDKIISEKPSMKKFNFSKNELNDIPNNINELIEMECLDLSYNISLSVLPKEIGELKQIQELNLNGTLVNQFHSHYLCLENLNSLHLQNTKMTKVSPLFFQLPSLKSLDLSFNQISSLFSSSDSLTPSSALAPLTHLHLQYNELSSFPTSISLFTDLEELNMCENKLEEIDDSLSSLTNLTNLNLSHNLLSALPASFFTLFYSLNTCSLKCNRIKSIPEEMDLSEYQISVTDLDISDNLLSTFPSFLSFFSSLSKLSAHSNKFKGTIEEDFFTSTSTSLTHLDISHNSLSSLPLSFYTSSFPLLSHLNLSFNSLSTLSPLKERNNTDNVEENIDSKNINEEVGIEGNREEIEDLEIFNEENLVYPLFPAIKELFLSSNSLRYLPSFLISDENTLVEVNISYNPLTSLPSFITKNENSKLRVLYASTLNLNENYFNELDFSFLTNLEQLDLSHNNISSFHESFYENCTCLVSLSLSHNSFSSFPDLFHPFYSLLIFDLSHNLLPSLPSSFQNLVEREVILNFNENPILSLSHDALFSFDVEDDSNISLSELFHLKKINFVQSPITDPLISYGCSDMLGKRPTMEDDWAVCGDFGGKENSLFLIFDGHAAQEVATLSAHYFPVILANKLGFKWEHCPGEEKIESNQEFENKEMKEKEDGEILKALDETFEEVNTNILLKYYKLGKLRSKHCGATALAILIINKKVFVANLGDARAIIVYPSSSNPLEEVSFKRISFDHKPYDIEESDRIRELGGYVENKRINGTLAVSRAFGDFYLTPFVSAKPFCDVFDFQFIENQRFCIVMGCDGVWDELSDENVSLFIQKSLFLQKEKPSNKLLDHVAEQLRDLAYCCGSDDNITVQLVVRN
eukprot:TRINITY_DN2670_c0_g4_i1.p1 TRINITY_DN2670_c0_g4~~TRINITY_DN2670_c0_g4_i1.p1  ORF type:complete len:994 (+),score=344.34 TRINITY_DN2670_c0_g4_i1:3-2984(+)